MNKIVKYLFALLICLVSTTQTWSMEMPDHNTSPYVRYVEDAAWFSNDPMSDSIRVNELPFSFVYGGKPSSEWLAGCQYARTINKLDENRVQHNLVFTDTTTGLVMTCTVVQYLDFPTIEWTLHFKNEGSVDTPIIENIQALDIRFATKSETTGEYLLHHNNGTLVTTINVPAGIRDYQPLTTELKPNTKFAFIPPQGRPCAGEWPYYNLAWTGGGAIIVVGWPGSWAARYERDTSNGLHVTAGQQMTHFTLHPQEDVRSPLIVIQRYQGDWINGQNIWRRWMFAHNMPRPGGKLPVPMTGASDCDYVADMAVDAEREMRSMDRHVEEKLLPDCWWIDAGWYKMTDEKGVKSYTYTGTWEVDPERFPNGLRPVFDYAKSKGINKGIVWFEPERVAPKRWLYTERPQWLLGREGEYKLLNMGNPEALEWVTNMVDKTMNDGGFTIYREDFNFGPSDCWTYNEPENRQGINEIKHVTGHLAFWTELLRRNPNRMIDTCASGGHRLDIETLRLSVPLWRTDYPHEPVGAQGMTYGLSMWVPYSGTGVRSDDPYIVRSDMSPFFVLTWNMFSKDVNYAGLRKLMSEWRRISTYYNGDFYPLTEYSVSNAVWIGWQFNRVDLNGGLVQLFRRADCPYIPASFKLKGLDPKMKYRVTNAGTGKGVTAMGAELMDEGIAGSITSKPGAVNYIYTKVESK